MPTPAQAAINQSKSTLLSDSVHFPSTISDFFMTFDFYDYRTVDKFQKTSTDPRAPGSALEPTRGVFSANKQSVQDQIKISTFARIALPIPSNLVDSFRVEWGAEQLGLTAGLMSEAWQGGQNQITGITNGDMGSYLNGGYDQFVGDAIKTGKQQIDTNDGTGIHMIRRIAAMGSPLFGQVTDLSFGVAENPNLVVLFRGPTLKQHTFSWKLIARTPAESESIKKIIAIFKRAMHPAKLNATTSAFLKYPAECLAEFHSPTSGAKPFLYPLRPTVVEDFTINYAPNGMPAFYNGTYDTVGVEITVKMQETSYYLRESFDDQAEYGSDGYNTSDLSRTSTGSDEDENLD